MKRWRAGMSILEVLIALVVLTTVMLPTITMMCSTWQQTVRAEDLAYFQGLSSSLLEAAARRDFQEVQDHASRPGAPTDAWSTWEYSILGKQRAGVSIRSWVEDTGDPDSLFFTVEVRWDRPADKGRRTDHTARVSRVLVRPEVSLSTMVPL